MYLRKLIHFNGVLGLTLPKDITNALNLSRGDYAEVYVRDSKTIVIKSHGVKPSKITVNDK